MADFRTELLVTGYIRHISPLPLNVLPLEIVNGIKKWNCVTYRLKNTFMIAFVAQQLTLQPFHHLRDSILPTPKFMPYSIAGHLSVKKLKLIVLRLNGKTGDDLHNIYKLWKWQYVIYKNSRIAIDQPQYRSQGTIAYSQPMSYRDGWLFHNGSQIQQMNFHNVITRNLQNQKMRIIQYFDNYYFWLQKELKLGNAYIKQVQVVPEKSELLVYGYIRIYYNVQLNDIINICLEMYLIKRDYWDTDKSDLKLCKIDTISNTVSARAVLGRDTVIMFYPVFGEMNISKTIAKKTWKLKYDDVRYNVHCFFGLTSDIDESKKCKCTNYGCYGKEFQVQIDDIITMEYKTINWNYQYSYGELSIGFNDSELTEFELIPIHNNQIYNLVVGFTESEASVQLLE